MEYWDQVIMFSAAWAFIVFVIIHAVILRWCSHKIFAMIQLVFCFGVLVLVPLFYFACTWEFGPDVMDVVLFLPVSFLVYALLCFFYILCIFGPFATSIRMRLMKELDTPAGKTLAEINKSYNDQAILDIRLNRLLSSGYIRLEQGKYQVNERPNAFFVIDAGAKKIQALIQSR